MILINVPVFGFMKIVDIDYSKDSSDSHSDFLFRVDIKGDLFNLSESARRDILVNAFKQISHYFGIMPFYQAIHYLLYDCFEFLYKRDDLPF